MSDAIDWDVLVQRARRLGRAPDAFVEPRLRAQLHVGFELDAWNADDAAQILTALFDDLERFARFVQPAPGAPLGVRLRAAGVVRAIAIAFRDPSSFEPARREILAESIKALLADRNIFVSPRAAFAVGAMASRWPGLHERVGMNANSPAMARRRAAALTAAWIFGDIERDELEKKLRAEGRGNDYVHGSAVQAMRLGWHLAPDTLRATLLEWLPTAPLPALASAGALDATIDEPLVRAAAIDRARALEQTKHPLVRPWLDAPPDVRELLAAYRELRRAARDDLQAASAGALDILARLPSLSRDADAAIDLVLFDSTLLRDVAIASARDAAQAVERRATWLSVVGAVRDARATLLEDPGVHAMVRNEHLRALSHALDAYSDERVGARASDWASLLALLRKRVAQAEETVLDRNAAIAMAICLEAAVTELDDADDFAFALGLPRRLLRHMADAFARPTLRNAMRAVIRLEDVLAGEPVAADLQQAVVDLADAIASFDATDDHPLALSLRGAAAAMQQMLRERGSDEMLEQIWVSAIAGFEDAIAGALTRLGLPAPPRRDRTTIAQRVSAALRKPQRASELGPWPLGDLLASASALRGTLARSIRPWEGHVIGDYQVVRELGAGGMGRCLLARLRSDRASKPWVLKVPSGRVRGPAGKANRDQFRQEAQALLGLASREHPSIVPFVAYHERGYASPFLVMGFVEGQSLARSMPLDPARAIRVTRDLASALAVAHAASIGHHDIKPDNIILSRDSAVLVDWGIAGAEFRTQCGTLGYMPHERFDRTKLDHQAALKGDIFALGAVAYEMLTGRPLALGPLDEHDAVIAPTIHAFEQSGIASDVKHLAVAQALAKEPRVLADRIRRHVGSSALADLLLAMTHPRHEDRPHASDVVLLLDRLRA